MLVGVFVLLSGLSAWLQFGLLEDPPAAPPALGQHDYDYYVLDFTAAGQNADGARYRIIADKMTHYPYDNRSLLERPEVVQYLPDETPRHIYADSGWLDNDNASVLLIGNVRVIQSGEQAAGGVSTVKRMVVRL